MRTGRKTSLSLTVVEDEEEDAEEAEAPIEGRLARPPPPRLEAGEEAGGVPVLVAPLLAPAAAAIAGAAKAASESGAVPTAAVAALYLSCTSATCVCVYGSDETARLDAIWALIHKSMGINQNMH